MSNEISASKETKNEPFKLATHVASSSGSGPSRLCISYNAIFISSNANHLHSAVSTSKNTFNKNSYLYNKTVKYLQFCTCVHEIISATVCFGIHIF